MSRFAIETEELTKRFFLPRGVRTLLRQPFARRSITAVKQVSLQIQEGELFGLLGPNGAGKTTLIKLLCTLIVPSSGQGRVLSHPLGQAGRVRQVVGLASGDERSFYWRLSGRHNLEFFAALYQLSPAEARRRAEQLLQQVGLAEQADRPFRTYSSGQKQRLGIARALLHQPRVLFLDEPTRSLDPLVTLAFHRFVEQELRRRQGMTIILSTHRLDEASRLCDRIAIMHRGGIQACGAPDDLRARLEATVLYRLWVRRLAAEPSWMGDNLPGRLNSTRLSENGDWLLELEATDGAAALSALVTRIATAGGEVQDVERHRPSLERIFQHFTQASQDQ